MIWKKKKENDFSDIFLIVLRMKVVGTIPDALEMS